MDHAAVADALFAAIESGDIDAVADLYAPDVAVWHNTDEVTQDREANLRRLSWVVANLRDRTYTDVRRQVTESGFVQQHVPCATSPSGQEVTVPACLVVEVRDGRIARIDEYLDHAQIAKLAL